MISKLIAHLMTNDKVGRRTDVRDIKDGRMYGVKYDKVNRTFNIKNIRVCEISKFVEHLR